MIVLALASALTLAEPPPQSAPRLVLPDPRVSFEPAYARIIQSRANASPTAVQRPLGGGTATGALGYLCGIDPFAPGSNKGGPGSSYGNGTTFLGAKLSLPLH